MKLLAHALSGIGNSKQTIGLWRPSFCRVFRLSTKRSTAHFNPRGVSCLAKPRIMKSTPTYVKTSLVRSGLTRISWTLPVANYFKCARRLITSKRWIMEKQGTSLNMRTWQLKSSCWKRSLGRRSKPIVRKSNVVGSVHAIVIHPPKTRRPIPTNTQKGHKN